MTPRAHGARWAAFHLHLGFPFEPFLAGPLAEAVSGARWSREVRRFFFIRYGEGGPHVRLRVLPRPGADLDAVRDLLEGALCEHVRRHPQEGARVETAAYVRGEHYFGDNLRSVYAELLNEQTSLLCLRMLRTPGMERAAARQAVLAAALDLLLRSAFGAGDRYRAAIEDSRRFGEETARAFGEEPHLAGAEVLNALLDRVGATVEAGLSRDPSVPRIGRLLRRVSACPPNGAFVATHALHLLCNKAGFSLSDEFRIFSVLRARAHRIAPEAASAEIDPSPSIHLQPAEAAA